MQRKSSLYFPPEVVEIIVGYLAFENPPTLLNFAKASKTFYACCRPAIKSIKFHDINLVVSLQPKEVVEDVNRLIERLKVEDGLRYVRQLIVQHPTHRAKRLDWEPPRMSELRCDKPMETYTTQYEKWIESFERDSPIYNRHSYEGMDSRASQAVVKLIKILPGLTDLIWSRKTHPSPSILEALHQDLPQCRLQLDNMFYFCTLHPEDHPLIEDPDFLTSPSIHSFKIGYYDYPYNHSYQKVLRFAGLPPNLKKVRLRCVPRGAFLGPEHFQSGTASLEALQFEFWQMFHPLRLYEWSYATDFSVLQVLKIHAELADETFDIWKETGLSSFPSLKVLRLNFGPGRYGSRDPRPVQFYDGACEFLQKLPPLTELELNNWHLRIDIDSLVDTHGSHLRKLKLGTPAAWQVVSRDQIRKISQKCTLLENLELGIDGAQSHAEKSEVYAALGSIRNLQCLDLHIEVALKGLPTLPRVEVTSSSQGFTGVGSEMPSDPSFDEFENEFLNKEFLDEESGTSLRLRNGHVRKVIVDSIVDEKLALQIFQSISEANPQSPLLFKDLTITVHGAHSPWFVNTFSSNWRVKRDSHIGRREKLIAREIELLKGWQSAGGRHDHLDPSWEPIFYRLFPAAKPKGQPRKISKKLAAKREKEHNLAIPTWRRNLHSFDASAT
jgi:hypothetical protein